jgi:hypothetical protein
MNNIYNFQRWDPLGFNCLGKLKHDVHCLAFQILAIFLLEGNELHPNSIILQKLFPQVLILSRIALKDFVFPIESTERNLFLKAFNLHETFSRRFNPDKLAVICGAIFVEGVKSYSHGVILAALIAKVKDAGDSIDKRQLQRASRSPASREQPAKGSNSSNQLPRRLQSSPESQREKLSSHPCLRQPIPSSDWRTPCRICSFCPPDMSSRSLLGNANGFPFPMRLNPEPPALIPFVMSQPANPGGCTLQYLVAGQAIAKWFD